MSEPRYQSRVGGLLKLGHSRIGGLKKLGP